MNKLLTIFFTLGLLNPTFGQRFSAADTSDYLFRFIAGKDMFYVPWNGNAEQLDSLLSVLSENTEQLRNGERYICVTSYAASAGTDIPAARMAYLRCQRVKSELITRGGLTESMFVTDRHIPAAYGADSLHNVVVVTFPANVVKVAELAGKEAAAKVEAYEYRVEKARQAEVNAARAKGAEQVAALRRKREEARLAAERAEQERLEAERLAAEQAEEERAEAARLAAETEAAAKAQPYCFALRANLLRWATLTPDVGFEWRINRDWGIMVNGSWTSWSWNEKDRRYALWEVSPEVRWYLGREKRGYVGATYKVGAFNYKLSATGKQGDLMGGGIVGGYRLKLNRSLGLDFSLGIGCIHADYDKYTVIDGVRVKRGKESRNWWGPTSAGITLVWNIF